MDEMEKELFSPTTDFHQRPKDHAYIGHGPDARSCILLCKTSVRSVWNTGDWTNPWWRNRYPGGVWIFWNGWHYCVSTMTIYDPSRGTRFRAYVFPRNVATDLLWLAQIEKDAIRSWLGGAALEDIVAGVTLLADAVWNSDHLPILGRADAETILHACIAVAGLRTLREFAALVGIDSGGARSQADAA